MNSWLSTLLVVLYYYKILTLLGQSFLFFFCFFLKRANHLWGCHCIPSRGKSWDKNILMCWIYFEHYCIQPVRGICEGYFPSLGVPVAFWREEIMGLVKLLNLLSMNDNNCSIFSVTFHHCILEHFKILL